MHTRLLEEEKGLAMVAVLLVSAMMLALGTIGIRSAQVGLRIASNDLVTNKALAAAEAGVNHAFSLMKADTDPIISFVPEFNDGFHDELSDGGISGALVSLGGVATVESGPYRFRTLGGGPTDGYFVRVIDNFDETPDDPSTDEDLGVKIISRGSVGPAKRTIEAIMKLDPAFQCGLFGKEETTLSGGADTDSFDSRDGDYDPASIGNKGCVRSNGNVELKSSGSLVNGDAVAGGTVSISNGSEVTGTVREGADPLEYPLVAPCGPPYSNGFGITGGQYNPATGHLKGAGGASIALADGTYCFSQISLTGNSTLTVNGPVRISVTADSDMSGGSIVNTTHLATNLQILASCSTVKVSGGSDAYMTIYAPDARLDFRGGTDFFGAVVARRIEDSGGTNVHYDVATSRIPGLPKTATLTAWREVRNF